MWPGAPLTALRRRPRKLADMTPLAALDRKIAALPADVFQVFTSSKSPATEKELAALEK